MPARFAVTVYMSTRYMASGSLDFSPSAKAAVADVGPPIRSTSLKASR